MSDRSMMRRLAAASVLAAVSLLSAAPLRAADEDVTVSPAVPPPPPPAERNRAERPPVDPTEARIKYLHDRLRITAAQEPLWSDVARVMRDNANAVAPIIKERLQSAERGSAMDNLGSYEKLGEAQLDGLKRFFAAFQALYGKLSTEQKKIADAIFRMGPLGMIGGIPQLAEDLVALDQLYSEEATYPAAAYPGYAMGPTYPVYPPSLYYSRLYYPRLYYPRVYYPPAVSYPFYPYQPWIWGPSVGFAIVPFGHFHGGHGGFHHR